MKEEQIFLKSLGCLSSIHLTQRLAEYLKLNGYDIMDEGSATTLIISCCIVTEEEEQNIVNLLLQNQEKRIFLVGCMNEEIAVRVQKYHSNMIAMNGYAEIERYFPPREVAWELVRFSGEYALNKIPSYISEKYDKYKGFVNVMGRLDPKTGEDICNSIIGYEFRNEQSSYYKVMVSEGCTHQCSFCLVKKVKGRYRSRAIEKILQDIAEGYEKGFRNFILIADEMSAYGIDLYKKYALGELLREIIDSFEGIKLQLRYLEPMHLKKIWKDIKPYITDKYISYLNVPIQSGSEKLLERIKRKTDLMYLKNILTEIRQNYSGPLLTHVIVGFKFEQDEDLDMTVQYLENFDNTSIHTFSPRKGTELENEGLHREIKKHMLYLENAQKKIRALSLKRMLFKISDVRQSEKELEYRYPVTILPESVSNYIKQLPWGKEIYQADLIFMNPQVEGFVARIRVDAEISLQFKIKEENHLWKEISIPVKKEELSAIVFVLHDYFQPMGIVEKTRRTFQLEEGISVCLDRVTHLGEYIEIEGINTDVKTVLDDLGLRREDSAEPYGKMLDELHLDTESEIQRFLSERI